MYLEVTVLKFMFGGKRQFFSTSLKHLLFIMKFNGSFDFSLPFSAKCKTLSNDSAYEGSSTKGTYTFVAL